MTRSRRPRIARRALEASRRAPVATSARERVASALEQCTAEERALLSLRLIEELTPTETGEALEVSVSEVSRTYTNLLAELRRTLRGMKFRPGSPAATPVDESLRRAS